jgi:type IV pilus assembly protein PilB
MPIYKFKALDAAGGAVEDSIEAPSEEEARQMVRQLGYFVTNITEVAGKNKGKGKAAGQTPLIDQWLTAAIGPFRPLIGFFKRPVAKSLPMGGEAKVTREQRASGKKPMPTSAPVRQARAAHGGRNIGQVLIELGFINEDELWEVLDEAKITGNLTGQVALLRGLITEDQLVQALAELHNLKVVDLEKTTPQQEAVAIVPETMARGHKVLPLMLKDNVLTVAIGDPNNLTALDDLRNLLGVKEVLALLASPRAIEALTTMAYQESVLDIIHQLEQDPELRARVARKEASIDLESLMEIQDASPIRKLINMVMLLAIRDHASDIHFEPFEDEFKMRYRCDGVLYELVPPPRHLATEIADRIKLMANLDTAERRLPQHGRIELNVGGIPMNMRVSVLPTMFGESVVIRLLDPTVVSLDLNKLGMNEQILSQSRQLIHKWVSCVPISQERATVLAQLRQPIHKPSGIILFTGPSGAGKTTTLYSALTELNESTDKIITAEDPLEYDLDGIVRCTIHELTSANALRSILGQDPDIIVVGEIRDHETAQVAVQAALSGRLVLSTLDANDAASSITRLRGMGLEPSLIAAAVRGILAQRLVRRICDDCRYEFVPSEANLMELNLRPQDVRGQKFYYGRGCDRCNNTGFRGRCGIFELIVMNDELRDMISSGASNDRMRTACWGQGMTTLREAGLKAVFSGVTSIEEVARETELERRS